MATAKKASSPTTAKKSAKKAAKKRTARSARGKTLVIVESPAKARTIHKYLGNDYVIEASMGHIIDLPKSRMAVDIQNKFEPEYITVRGRAPILNRLKKLAEASKEVLLAPDPDREGEAISWHLKRALSPRNSNIRRVEFNEITPQAVKEAIAHPRDIDENLVNAQQARRILDRLVGYSLSPILWKKIKRGLSAGRVQSIALRLICDREKEIDAFVPREYWTVDAKLQKNKTAFPASLNTIDGQKVDLKTEDDVQGMEEEMKSLEFKVSGITKRERKRQPTAPYTTSRMQQDAANKLGFTSQKTMMVAQQLYEGLELANGVVTGLITYMRTDSTRINPAAAEQVRSYIKEKHGNEYLSPDVRQYKSNKSAQDAHEAIRPTDPTRTPESIQSILSRDQFRLYQLIWQKFVSSQMADEIADHTSVDIQAGKYGFRANGRIVKFAGFSVVFSPEEAKKKKDKDNKLPDLEEGDILKLMKVVPEQHFTQPPPRFNDASMVKTLEESGVGRPSTYAPTIQTLLKRFYVTRIQKALKPTDLGKLVNELMVNHFPRMVNTEFTARMEDDLDRVANSDLQWTAMLQEFYTPFSKTIQDAQENIEEMRNVLDEPTDLICEKCGRNMVKKIGRNGYFLACPGFPECKNARAIPLGPCPSCEDGEVIQRATKRGRAFYGCTNYPDCEFSSWDRPVEGRLCPSCGKLLLEKSSREKGKYVACSSCDFEEAAAEQTA
ncbi:MAG: type I DNA topoisomerase [Leptospiraceae bacterium]|nr:type I DNA topoisomerase [Leptospiraceae bacterium]